MPLHLLRHNPAELERIEEQRPFSRKRFDQLVAAERAAAEAERLATGIKIRKQREKALALAAFNAAQSMAERIRTINELQSVAAAIRRQQEAEEADDGSCPG
jgi:hypothetical protein